MQMPVVEGLWEGAQVVQEDCEEQEAQEAGQDAQEGLE
jgi:hypothetical protein